MRCPKRESKSDGGGRDALISRVEKVVNTPGLPSALV